MIPIGDMRRRFGFPWMTVALLALGVVFFLYERRAGLDYSILSLIPQNLEAGQHGTLLQQALTCLFVQGPGWLEPIVNLVYLWVLGNKVEDACGAGGLLGITLLSTVSAAAVKMIVHPRAEEPVYGLAGVIAGLFGAYFVLYGFRPILAWLPPIVMRLTPVPVLVHLLYWAGLEFVNINFGLLRSGQILRSVSFEPTWPFAGALVTGLIAGQLFAQREYLWAQARQVHTRQL